MDIKRTVLWVIFFMSAVMLYDNWQRDHGRPSMFFPGATQTQPAKGAAPEPGAPSTASDLPSATTGGEAPANAPTGATAATAAQPAEAAAQLVHFRTDLYDGLIDTRGGNRDGRGIRRGDAYVLNDPYRGGTHLPDITVIVPVFYGDEAEPSAFVARLPAYELISMRGDSRMNAAVAAS